MTPAERQRRRRKRLKAERLAVAAAAKAERQRRLKGAEHYIPVPPGVTCWHKVEVLTPEGGKEIWAPTTRPYPSLAPRDFENTDILVLLGILAHEAGRRRLFPAETLAALGPLLTAGEEAVRTGP